MGLPNNGEGTPDTATYPMGTPEELRAAGYDPSSCLSCAVPNIAAGIRGCSFAARCSRVFSRPKLGGWGPATPAPGTSGHGPENVPFSIKDSDGRYMESFMRCTAFLSGPYPRLIAANDPEEPTGEQIKILGVAGKAQIYIEETLPVDPGKCNKSGNVKMHTERKVITVPKHARLADTLKGSPEALRKAGEKEIDEELADMMLGESLALQEEAKADPVAPGDDVLPPVVALDDVVGAVVSEPVRRGGRRDGGAGNPPA